tara:strand:+ start:1931 stop:2512 length:582 start_codon:yes stop_codon:yes gene_type:complete
MSIKSKREKRSDTDSVLEDLVIVLKNKKLLTLVAALQKAVVAKEEEKFLIILFDQRDAYSANVIKNGQTDILEAFFELKSTGRDLKIKIEYLVKEVSEWEMSYDLLKEIRKQVADMPYKISKHLVATFSGAVKQIVSEELSSPVVKKYHALLEEYVEWLSELNKNGDFVCPEEARDRIILLGQAKGLLQSDED